MLFRSVQFTVTEDQVHTILIFQNPMRALKSLPCPWMNARETPAISDFVQVINSVHQGKKGCIKMLGVNLNNDVPRMQQRSVEMEIYVSVYPMWF